MKKMKDHSTQVLNLQEIHEVEQEEKAKKNRVLPIIFLIVGSLLVLVGFFYKDIASLIEKSKKEEKVNTPVQDPNKLNCNYKKDDTSLGINYTFANHYTFTDRKLKKGKFRIVISKLPNSDIASDNIKVLNGKYSDIINSMNTVEGLSATVQLKNDILTIEYDINYKVLDSNKFPKNDKIVLNNTLDEEYSSVKRKNQESGYLC